MPPEHSSTRARRGYSAVCDQWLINPSGVWWESTSSLSVEGLGGPDFAKVGSSLNFAKSLIQVLRRVWITSDSESEMLIMVVACSSEQSYNEKRELDPIAAEAIRTSYTEARESLFDGCKFAMRSHLIDEIANDAFYYKELSFHAKEFTASVESLLRSFAVSYSDTQRDPQWKQRAQGIVAEMQGIGITGIATLDQSFDSVRRKGDTGDIGGQSSLMPMRDE
ncbi:uncharacterized protein PG998_014594 [Apiospora kogelbergensis]|uniref:uncharacterized protein n=1 Tax=Apiospora kogelbergensis TaxID=1337665 RepID=UPI0031318B15